MNDLDQFILPPLDPYYEEIEGIISKLHKSMEEMADFSWLAEYLASPEYLHLLELAPPMDPELFALIAGHG